MVNVKCDVANPKRVSGSKLAQSAKPVRKLKSLNENKKPSNDKHMQILLTNKIQRKHLTTKTAFKAQRVANNGGSNQQMHQELTDNKKLFCNKQDKQLSRREQLEIWRAEKGRLKKENCHPLLSRKRSLAKVIASPSYKRLVHTKKDDGPINNRRRQTMVLQKDNFSLKLSKENQKRRKTICDIHDKGIQNNNCLNFKSSSEDDVMLKTSWQNKTLSRRERLELWLHSKGKTPLTPFVLKSNRRSFTKSPHPTKQAPVLNKNTPITTKVCPPSKLVTDEKYEEGTVIQHEDVTKRLTKIMDDIEKVSDYEIIQDRLDDILRDVPTVVQHAEYWICRARVAAHDDDVQRVVCLLEQAYTFDAKPEEKIKEEICSFLQKIESEDNNTIDDGAETNLFSKYAITPGRRVHFAVDTMSPLQFKSSIIRFCIVESKSFKKRLNAQIKRKIMTPVRRSVRLQHANIPEYLRSTEKYISSPSQVESDIIKGQLSFCPNKSINTPLNNGWLIHEKSIEEEGDLEVSFT